LLSRLVRERIGRYRRPLLLAVLLQVVQTVALLLLPTLNAAVIDNGLVRGDTGFVWRAGGLMLLVTLVEVTAGLAVVLFAARAAMGMSRDLRHEMFHRVRRMPVTEVDVIGVPSLTTRTIIDVAQIEVLVLLGLTVIVSVPIICVGGIILALRQSLPLASLLLVAVPLLALAIGAFNRRTRPTFDLVQNRLDTIARVLREQISGVRVVRAFGREAAERDRFAAVNDDLRRAGLRVGQTMALLVAGMTLLLNVSGIAVVWFGGRLLDAGDMRLGALTAFLTYLAQVLGALVTLGGVLLAVPRASVAAGRLDEVLRPDPATPAAADGRTPLTTSAGVLSLRGVGFRHSGAGQPVLTGVDLDAGPGRTVAVIGGTGSGKSTLLGLIARLADATDGSITLDGVDMRDLEPAARIAAVGLVPQRAHLFSGTVATNLRHGAPDATDEELWHALEVAQAHDFVAATPEGLGHPVAQGGANLSGGQRQRLAIAAMLVRRPSVYLFDDAFSALDHTTERALRRALVTETAHATTVIAAQRPGTVRDADTIIVLDRGRVAAAGTHDELAATDPAYRQILETQPAAA
jgi:ATP-binding cassette subfamily B multidrug efflux pump